VPGENGSIAHAQLVCDGGMIMLGSPRGEDFDDVQKTPAAVGGLVTQSAYVVVPDVDAHYERAKAAGATIVSDIRDEPHGRGYSCCDPEGHLWNFGDYDPWGEES
jgi:uncharacterized glyoxalase superfamily protein PhnB